MLSSLATLRIDQPVFLLHRDGNTIGVCSEHIWIFYVYFELNMTDIYVTLLLDTKRKYSSMVHGDNSLSSCTHATSDNDWTTHTSSRGEPRQTVTIARIDHKDWLLVTLTREAWFFGAITKSTSPLHVHASGP